MEKRACSPDDDGNAQRFLADEVIQTTATESYVKYQALSVILVVMPWKYSIIRWCSGSLALGLGGGKCRLARARIERPQSALKSRRSRCGLGYGGSRRGRYRRHRRKRFYGGGGDCR